MARAWKLFVALEQPRPVTKSEQGRRDDRKGLRIASRFLCSRGARLETPKLIIEWDGETPTSAMCSACRAIFPTVEGKGPEANRQRLESSFEKHVKAEHSAQPPPWQST